MPSLVLRRKDYPIDRNMIMVVSVQFCGFQRAITRTEELEVSLLDNSRVDDLFLHVKRCYPDLPLSRRDVTVSVNDKVSALDRLLKPADRISFLPHIGGGRVILPLSARFSAPSIRTSAERQSQAKGADHSASRLGESRRTVRPTRSRPGTTSRPDTKLLPRNLAVAWAPGPCLAFSDGHGTTRPQAGASR